MRKWKKKQKKKRKLALHAKWANIPFRCSAYARKLGLVGRTVAVLQVCGSSGSHGDLRPNIGIGMFAHLVKTLD